MAASPCTKVCTLDAAGRVCIGCGRTLTEIARWASAGDPERRAILAAARERMTMAEVEDNAAEQRFELTVDGAVAFAAYERAGDALVFTHTIVPEAMRGDGVGSRLIAGALGHARAQGLKVVPECPFVAAYLEKHPDAAEVAA